MNSLHRDPLLILSFALGQKDQNLFREETDAPSSFFMNNHVLNKTTKMYFSQFEIKQKVQAMSISE